MIGIEEICMTVLLIEYLWTQQKESKAILLMGFNSIKSSLDLRLDKTLKSWSHKIFIEKKFVNHWLKQLHWWESLLKKVKRLSHASTVISQSHNQKSSVWKRTWKFINARFMVKDIVIYVKRLLRMVKPTPSIKVKSISIRYGNANSVIWDLKPQTS